jgi:hypothetical protein
MNTITRNEPKRTKKLAEEVGIIPGKISSTLGVSPGKHRPMGNGAAANTIIFAPGLRGPGAQDEGG